MLKKSHGNNTLVFTPKMKIISFSKKYDSKMSIPLFCFPPKEAKELFENIYFSRSKKKEEKKSPKKNCLRKFISLAQRPLSLPS